MKNRWNKVGLQLAACLWLTALAMPVTTWGSSFGIEQSLETGQNSEEDLQVSEVPGEEDDEKAENTDAEEDGESEDDIQADEWKDENESSERISDQVPVDETVTEAETETEEESSAEEETEAMEEAESVLQTIRVVRYGKSEKPLAGVTYRLESVWLADDAEPLVLGGTTDSKGEVLWEGLPQGEYRLTETSTVDGYELLQEPITVIMPRRVTAEDAAAKKLDLSDARYDEAEDSYYFDTAEFQITESQTMAIPMTGGAGVLSNLGLAAAWLLIGMGIAMMQRRFI